MANTMKFGNGQWATQKDSILAFNDENANFKPLPFTASRASTATRVNKLGLIETVGAGIPRVDYLGNTSGAYLLEPSSTNLITQSEAFGNSYWIKSGASVVGGFASPSASSPLGAFKLTEDSNNGNHYIVKQNAFTTNGNNHTWSLYAKRAENRYIALTNRQGAGIDGIVIFDLQDGGFSSTPTTVIDSWFSEELSNGWFKISFVSKTNGSPYDNFVISLSKDGNSDSYQGDGTSGVYIFGAQLEQSSYATSYIPTAGSAITRLADTASQTLPDGVIGQTEGVLFVDFIHEDSIASDRWYASLTNGGSNYITIGHYSTTLYMRIFNGSEQAPINYNQPLVVGRRYKVAINYALNNVSFYVDGVLFATDTNATIPTTSLLSLQRGSFIQTNKVNDLRVYNTVLTDAELVKLTTI